MKTQEDVKQEEIKEVTQEVLEAEKITPATPDSEPFELMDQQDDEQILAEVQGKGAAIAEDWVYSFQQDGKEVTGLSWTGTKNAAYWFRRKKMADLAITQLDVQPDPTNKEYMLVKAYCEDKINGGGMWGTKRQWIKLKTRNGGIIDNPFWYEQATSKAQRNAMQAMMPADWIAKLVKDWIQDGKVKKLAPTGKYQADSATPRPLPDDPIKRKKVFWARFFQLKSYSEAQTLLDDMEKDTIVSDADKYAIKKKVEEKKRSLIGSEVDEIDRKSSAQVPPEDDIPF